VFHVYMCVYVCIRVVYTHAYSCACVHTCVHIHLAEQNKTCNYVLELDLLYDVIMSPMAISNNDKLKLITWSIISAVKLDECWIDELKDR